MLKFLKSLFNGPELQAEVEVLRQKLLLEQTEHARTQFELRQVRKMIAPARPRSPDFQHGTVEDWKRAYDIPAAAAQMQRSLEARFDELYGPMGERTAGIRAREKRFEQVPLTPPITTSTVSPPRDDGSLLTSVLILNVMSDARDCEVTRQPDSSSCDTSSSSSSSYDSSSSDSSSGDSSSSSSSSD